MQINTSQNGMPEWREIIRRIQNREDGMNKYAKFSFRLHQPSEMPPDNHFGICFSYALFDFAESAEGICCASDLYF